MFAHRSPNVVLTLKKKMLRAKRDWSELRRYLLEIEARPKHSWKDDVRHGLAHSPRR